MIKSPFLNSAEIYISPACKTIEINLSEILCDSDPDTDEPFDDVVYDGIWKEEN